MTSRDDTSTNGMATAGTVTTLRMTPSGVARHKSIIPDVVSVGARTGREEDRRADDLPPASNKGGNAVNIGGFEDDIPDSWKSRGPKLTGETTVGLHWVSLTLFCELDEAWWLYEQTIGPVLGELSGLDHGVVGFRGLMMGLYGFKLAYDPVSLSKDGKRFCCFIIPGAACEQLQPSFLRHIRDLCNEKGVEVRCSRVDYKYDFCPFSPYQFRWMVKNSLVHAAFKGGKIRHIQNDDDDEIGLKGQMTVYTGALSSSRFLCCYDTHGFTRLEMRNKDERAEMLFLLLSSSDVGRWYDRLLAIMKDYIYLDDPLWSAFIGSVNRAYMPITRRPDPTLERLAKTFRGQWAQGLSVLYDCMGPKWFQGLLEWGRAHRKDNGRYQVILHAYGLEDG